LQGLAAVVVLIGAGIGASMTLRQVRATRAQITETARASAKQLKLSEQGQVTDRYTKAIDQLDEKNALAVRLGGLYALERIARDSPDDRATIAEVLCAYVRTAPRADPPPDSAAKLSSLAFRAPDVQAALTILGRWQERLDEPPDIDLHGAEIQGADLDEADLNYAYLVGAQLQGAILEDADLHGAGLDGAQLQGANLDEADLRGANLLGARLQGANLLGADLQGANLLGARLQGAKLLGADLQGANLDGADLQGATADEETCWPDGWDQDRIAAAGVRVL
jgi:uncharacterized protein YjbI with pentapeptide repeats